MLDRCVLPWCWTGASYLDAGQVILTLMLDRCLTLMLDRCILPWCWTSVSYLDAGQVFGCSDDVSTQVKLVLASEGDDVDLGDVISCYLRKHTNTLKPQLHAHSIWWSNSLVMFWNSVFMAVVFDFPKSTEGIFRVQVARKQQYTVMVYLHWWTRTQSMTGFGLQT